MKVLQLEVRHFRGFASATVRPQGHVLLVGEPRAGRSDLIAALTRVLSPDSTRGQLDEWDFHRGDVAQDVEVEVVLGSLGPTLRQRFLRELEFWDHATGKLVAATQSPDELAQETHEPVLRLAYRGRWDQGEEVGEHWVHYPKDSEPAEGDFHRASRAERQALPFLAAGSSRPLALAAGGEFRRLLEATDADGVGAALRSMADGVEALSAQLSSDPAVLAGLDAVLSPLRDPLDVRGAAQDVVRFLPEGGSVSGLLRALHASVDLGDGTSRLPLRRHGSTTAALFAAAETLAAVGSGGAVVVLDDFGDRLDSGAAERLAGRLRAAVGQLWLSTRRPEAARAFASNELVRLARSSGARTVHHARTPVSSSERLAARHLHRQLLSAMTARAVVVCEGTHDSTALDALAERLDAEQGIAPLCAFGVRLVDAGGINEVPRLCELACGLGFRTVGAIDHDGDPVKAASDLAAVEASADAVVRLPRRHAIERALLVGVPDADIRAALRALDATYSVSLPATLDTMGTGALVDAATHVLKKNNGLHAQFVAALPAGSLPPLAIRLLAMMLELARGVATGTVELT